MTRTLLLATAFLVASALPVGAEPGPATEALWCPETPQQTAILAGEAARVPGLEREVTDLKAERDGLKAQIGRLEEIAKLDAVLLVRQERITAFADDERDRYKQALDDERKRDRKDSFWSRVRQRAAEGALIGSLAGTALPGVGNVAGALGGGLLGGVVGAVESFAGAP